MKPVSTRPVQPEPARIDLLGQIGHRHGGHAAEQEAFGGAQGQKPAPAGHEGAGDVA